MDAIDYSQGRLRLELEVPRHNCVFPRYARSLHGKDIKLLPDHSTKVWQDPTTGTITMMPHWAYPPGDPSLVQYVNDIHMGLDDVIFKPAMWHEILQMGEHGDKGEAKIPYFSVKWSPEITIALVETLAAFMHVGPPTNNTDKAPGLLNLTMNQAIIDITQIEAAHSEPPAPTKDIDLFACVMISKTEAEANQEWHFNFKNFGHPDQKGTLWCGFGFGQYYLGLNLTGKAHLMYVESWEDPKSKRQKIADFQWTTPGTVLDTHTDMTIMQEPGILKFSFNRSGSTRMAPSFHPNEKSSGTQTHVVRIPKQYMTWNAEEHQLDVIKKGKWRFWANCAYRWCFSVQKVIYPDLLGTAYCAETQLSPAPPIDNDPVPLISSKDLTYHEGELYLRGGQNCKCYQPGRTPDGSKATTGIDYSFFDGDIIDPSTPFHPLPWASDGGEANRIGVKMDFFREAHTTAKPTLHKTAQHYAHTIKFNPEFIDDPRQMISLYCGKEVTLTLHQQPWKDSLDVSLILERGEDRFADPSISEATAEALWNIFRRRGDTTCRLWWEVTPTDLGTPLPNDRTQDTLLFAGYVDRDSPPEYTFVNPQLMILNMKFRPMWQRLKEMTLIDPESYDGKYLYLAFEDLFNACEFEVDIDNEWIPGGSTPFSERYASTSEFKTTLPTEDPASGYEGEGDFSNSDAGILADIMQSPIPGGTKGTVAQWKPTVGAPVENAVIQYLKLSWRPSFEAMIYWDLEWISDGLGNTLPHEFWHFRTRKGCPAVYQNPPIKYFGPDLDSLVREHPEAVPEPEEGLSSANYFEIESEWSFVALPPEVNMVHARVIDTSTDGQGQGTSPGNGLFGIKYTDDKGNPNSLAVSAASVLDPLHPDYMGRTLRALYLTPNETTEEELKQLTDNVLQAAGHTHSVAKMVVTWHPLLKPDDKIKVLDYDGTLMGDLWIKEVNVSFSNPGLPRCRVVADMLWETAWEGG